MSSSLPSSTDIREGRTDWELIFSREFLARPGCWKTCGDGFCCNPTRVQQHFSFLRSRGVDLPHLPGEYHHLRNRGLLQSGFANTFTRSEIRLENGKTFPLYRGLCQLEGLCSDHHHRPVVCRIYPFMPLPDLDGNLESIQPTGLVDIYWDLLKKTETPCTIDALNPDEVTGYNELCAELFADPVNIFYFKAAALYKDRLRRTVAERYPQMLEMEEAEFFRAWEKMLVMGWLYKPSEILSELTELYIALEDRWGDEFSTEGL